MPNPDTPDILKKIVDVKRREVEHIKTVTPISELETLIERQAVPLDLCRELMGDSVRVIAEIKKASPVKGVLRDDFDPVTLSTSYADNGAAAVSVLTNFDHFQGTIEHMEAVHRTVNPRGLPVLRKEFIFDPYQVHEARAHGADAILLIVAMLTPDCLKELLDLSATLQMQSIVEVHDERELTVALDAGAEIIGINNRDLRAFKTELETTERLAPLVPTHKIVVSESGISTREDVQRVKASGAHAVLVGEALVTAKDPGAKLRELT